MLNHIKYVALLSCLVLGVPFQSWAVQNTLDTDVFTGTNGDTLTAYNANWNLQSSTQTNNCQIQGTPGMGGAGCGAYRTGHTWTNNQWAEATIDATTLANRYIGVGVRMQTDNTFSGYVCGGNFNSVGPDYRIFSVANAIFTTLYSSSQNVAVGDIVNCEADGTTITIRVNGTVLSSVTDTTYTTGNPGIFVDDTVLARRAGTWHAGSVTVSGGGGGGSATYFFKRRN